MMVKKKIKTKAIKEDKLEILSMIEQKKKEMNKIKEELNMIKIKQSQKKEEQPQLSYTNDEGKRLYGFSQVSLDENNKKVAENNIRLGYHSKILKIGVLFGVLILGGFLAVTIYILYQIMKYDLVTKAINSCS